MNQQDKTIEEHYFVPSHPASWSKNDWCSVCGVYENEHGQRSNQANKTITDAVAVIGFQIHDIYLNCKKSPRGVPFLNKKEGLEFARLQKSIDKTARKEVLKVIKDKHRDIEKTCEEHPDGQRNCSECYKCKYQRLALSELLQSLKEIK